MPSRLTWILRKVLGTVGGRTLAVLVLLILIYQIWISVTAVGKVADGVGDDPDARGRFAVATLRATASAPRRAQRIQRACSSHPTAISSQSTAVRNRCPLR